MNTGSSKICRLFGTNLGKKESLPLEMIKLFEEGHVITRKDQV